MIHVEYSGRLGNNLFQFAHGLILSRLSGVPLCCQPLGLFPGTQGFRPASGPAPAIAWDAVRTPRRWFDPARFAALARECDVVVDGNQHDTAYFEPHKALLAEVLRPNPGPFTASKPDEVVLHLRLGDFFHNPKWPLATKLFSYPVEVVHRLLARLDYARCWIVTDSPEAEAVAHIVRHHRGACVGGDMHHHFRTLYHARRLIMTPSTFSWWAAWIGDATEVHFPRDLGYWKSANDFALNVREPRYHLYGEGNPG